MIQRNVLKRFTSAEVLEDKWFKRFISKKLFNKVEEKTIVKYLNNMKMYQVNTY
jgi:hypothetical protein